MQVPTQPTVTQESQLGAPAVTAPVQQTPALAPIAEQAAPITHLAQITTQAVSQAEPRNVTKIAFGQITDLGTEFHQLREDDKAHVKQLGVDIHLRENLEQQLHAAEERLEHDNAELAQETGSIVTSPSADGGSPQTSTSESVSPSLVQAQSMKVKAVSDQIAVATERDVKTLDADINSLHARDAGEMKALRGNAETRSALSAQIAKERDELMANSETLAANLGQIRDLVAPSNAAAVASATPSSGSPDASSSAASLSSEAMVQQDAVVQQDSPAAEESVPAAAPSSAPEAASGSTWLR
jgi:hypothetical protein